MVESLTKKSPFKFLKQEFHKIQKKINNKAPNSGENSPKIERPSILANEANFGQESQIEDEEEFEVITKDYIK
jgi:hypothetical protein